MVLKISLKKKLLKKNHQKNKKGVNNVIKKNREKTVKKYSEHLEV